MPYKEVGLVSICANESKYWRKMVSSPNLPIKTGTTTAGLDFLELLTFFPFKRATLWIKALSSDSNSIVVSNVEVDNDTESLHLFKVCELSSPFTSFIPSYTIRFIYAELSTRILGMFI
ncbi:hypothetical protein GIB67_037784 [Kingdonia uniflora]|uniref:Uncharacterized protein n=1 Tax=Kingdonia uniflora TaxID=39325 RepID=A0A7J7LV86_9MAGN|nr:hypothetical protein GIB67_037784 [Kingdonia uniflora]